MINLINQITKKNGHEMRDKIDDLTLQLQNTHDNV